MCCHADLITFSSVFLPWNSLPELLSNQSGKFSVKLTSKSIVSSDFTLKLDGHTSDNKVNSKIKTSYKVHNKSNTLSWAQFNIWTLALLAFLLVCFFSGVLHQRLITSHTEPEKQVSQLSISGCVLCHFQVLQLQDLVA